MNDISPRKIKTGGDPCSLPDYSALRDEMSKLEKNSRAEIDWRRVQTLCLRLFESNGVELESACWYTLARIHIAGFAGMNDGLFITVTLIRYQWSKMWPPGSHARDEILSVFGLRLQEILSTQVLSDHQDLNILYQSEKCLSELCSCLMRHDLRQVRCLDTLLQQVRSAITHLEKMPQSIGTESGKVLPFQAVMSAESYDGAVRFIWSAEPEREQVTGEVIISPRKMWLQGFLSGAFSALIISGALLPGLKLLTGPIPEELQLEATLTPLPQTLSSAQLNRLWHNSTLTEKDDRRVIEATRLQLAWLESLPPDWTHQYGHELIRQARILWPDNPDVVSMQTRWRKYTDVAELSFAELHSWREGIKQLDMLTARLNATDETQGRYITVRELKIAVSEIRRAFNSSAPSGTRLSNAENSDRENVAFPEAKRHVQSPISRAVVAENEERPVPEKAHF